MRKWICWQWFLLQLPLSIGINESNDPVKCMYTGQPCLEFYVGSHSVCSHARGDITSFRKSKYYDYLVEDDFPWSIEQGSDRTLCCDVAFWEPLQRDTIRVEWLYYENSTDIGGGDYKIVKENEMYDLNYTFSNDNHNTSYLKIKKARLDHSGVYVCRASAGTLAPKGHEALALGRLANPIFISVYSSQLSFASPQDTSKVELNTESYEIPWTELDYTLERDTDPRKTIILDVETDENLIQYIDIRVQYKLIVSAYGPKESLGFSENFTVKLYYEGVEENAISRTWTLTGSYSPKLESTKLYMPQKEGYDIIVPEDKGVPFYVIGPCDLFNYSVTIGSLKKELDNNVISFDKEDNTLQYRFTSDYSSGELAGKNAYVELKFSTTEEGKYISASVEVTCVANKDDSTRVDLRVRGKPLFPTDLIDERNCLTYEQEVANEEYFGLLSPPLDKGVRGKICCKTEGNNYKTHLWLNGKPAQQDKDSNFFLQFDGDRSDVQETYPWFKKYAGYYQCIVGDYNYMVAVDKSYELENNEGKQYFPQITSRTIKIGFKRAEEVKISQLSATKSFLNVSKPTDASTGPTDGVANKRDATTDPTDDVNNENVSADDAISNRDVTKYLVQLVDDSFLVVNGSCVGVEVNGMAFPTPARSWSTKNDGKLFDNHLCNKKHEPVPADKQALNYIFDPYDEVHFKSLVYVLMNLPSESVTIKMNDREEELDLTTIESYLAVPNITQTDKDVMCYVSGYPLDNVTLYSIDKTTRIVLKQWNIEEDSVIRDATMGFEVELEYHLSEGSKVKNMECVAVNSLMPEGEQEKSSPDFSAVTDDPGLDLVIVVIIVISLLVFIFLLWILCACIVMSRHPHTKFGQALCCQTGPYKVVEEKLPLEPYKLPYHALVFTRTLGDGNFGIVRQAICTNVPDRPGERVEVAVKEVKPCAERERREEEMRRERDIMMLMRSHRNVLRVYGYTDEPDVTAIVMELADRGSLDIILAEARRIKSSGYLLPDEHLSNPIKAVEPHHILDFCRQIADGMEYIGRCGFVHRDLAARNIVVAGSGDEYTLKIADFGLAREINDDGVYARAKGKEIPIKWTAPESLETDLYNTKSDVWSYGILLWEICTLGGDPYHGRSNAETKELVRTGYRLQKPPCCHDDVYDLMASCWLKNQDDRPDFKQILETLTSYSQAPSIYIRSEDMYETECDLTLRLAAIESSPGNSNHHGNNSVCGVSRDLRGSRDLCESREQHDHVTSSAGGMCASNEYSADPTPNEMV